MTKPDLYMKTKGRQTGKISKWSKFDYTGTYFYEKDIITWMKLGFIFVSDKQEHWNIYYYKLGDH